MPRERPLTPTQADFLTAWWEAITAENEVRHRAFKALAGAHVKAMQGEAEMLKIIKRVALDAEFAEWES